MVRPGSAADQAGLAVGDVLTAIDGEVPRDVIRYQLLVDGPDPIIEIERSGLERSILVTKADGEPLGVEVQAAVFDQVRTCDNHCSFCFIYQLPKGMRRSLYLKDDDYRLSFLYGNFTTLTRFTEADLERVITENLSPLYVSIHATDPLERSRLLRNRRGGSSLRWLRALLDAGVEVHGQVVVCPGVNDGPVLEQTMVGILNRYPELASVAVVPLGVSDHSNEADMRPHTAAEAEAVVDLVAHWQDVFSEVLGRRLVFAADEYYLLADRPFPPAEVYGDFSMYEDGIGMARHFEAELFASSSRYRTDGTGGDGDDVETGSRTHRTGGFFASVDGAPALGYRAPRTVAATEDGSPGDGDGVATPVSLGRRRPAADAPVGVVTGRYGAAVLAPLIDRLRLEHPGLQARLVPVDNRFFGGNIGVTGLMVGEDVARTLATEPAGHRYLVPDVCLSEGRFLDGLTVEDLPHPVEVIPTDGAALRAALGLRAEHPVPA